MLGHHAVISAARVIVGRSGVQPSNRYRPPIRRNASLRRVDVSRKDDCCACRFDKCVETLCENGIDAIRAVFSRSNPAVQYSVDVEKEKRFIR